MSDLPTGTVSSGRDGSPHAAAHVDDGADPETRIAELERENEALRAAVETQRRENERLIERCERLLEGERGDRDGTDDAPADAAESSDALDRVARFLGR